MAEHGYCEKTWGAFHIWRRRGERGMIDIRKKLRRLLGCFRNNALAIASLCIAAMGLYLTITSQSEERAHKELLLRPVLTADVQAGDYSVSVFNYGLGPAL